MRRAAYTDADGVLVYPSLAARPRPDVELGPVDRMLGPAGAAVMIAAVIGYLLVARDADGEVPMHFGVFGAPPRTGDIWGEGLWVFVGLGLVWAGMLVLSRYPRLFNYPHMLTAHNAQAQYRNGVQAMRRIAALIPVLLLDLVLIWSGAFPTPIMTWAALLAMVGVVLVGVIRAFRLTGTPRS